VHCCHVLLLLQSFLIRSQYFVHQFCFVGTAEHLIIFEWSSFTWYTLMHRDLFYVESSRPFASVLVHFCHVCYIPCYPPVDSLQEFVILLVTAVHDWLCATFLMLAFRVKLQRLCCVTLIHFSPDVGGYIRFTFMLVAVLTCSCFLLLLPKGKISSISDCLVTSTANIACSKFTAVLCSDVPVVNIVRLYMPYCE